MTGCAAPARTLAVAAITTVALGTRLAGEGVVVGGSLFGLVALGAALALVALGAFVLVAVAAVALVVAALFAVVILALVGTILVLVAIEFAARPLLFLLRAHVGDDAEIVVGELQVVFGLHPVAVERGIVRELLVLLEHLRRVAPGSAIDPVALVAAALATIAATAAPAILIAILVQRKSVSLTSDRALPVA